MSEKFFSTSIYVCPVRLKRGKITINAQSPITDGHLSDRPDREHGNPLEPDRTPDDVGKNLANVIVAGFRRISSPLGFDFLRFLRFYGESANRAWQKPLAYLSLYNEALHFSLPGMAFCASHIVITQKSLSKVE